MGLTDVLSASHSSNIIHVHVKILLKVATSSKTFPAFDNENISSLIICGKQLASEMKHHGWKVINVATQRSDARVIDTDQQHLLAPHLQMDGVHLELGERSKRTLVLQMCRKKRSQTLSRCVCDHEEEEDEICSESKKEDVTMRWTKVKSALNYERFSGSETVAEMILGPFNSLMTDGGIWHIEVKQEERQCCNYIK